MNRLNMRRLLTTYFLYECGRAMYFVLITWFLYQWTQDAIYTGIFVSFGFLPGLFSNLVFGVVIDRSNRKKLASLAGGGSIGCLLLLWGAFLLGLINPWVMILTHMVLQTLGSLFRPSLQALVAEVFKKNDLPRIFSLSGSATISGSLTGAALGGILSGLLPVSISLLIVTGLYIGAFFTVLFVSYEPSSMRKPAKASPFFQELQEGFVYLKRHHMLHGLFAMMMLGQLTFHTILGFLSVYTSAYLNQTSTVYGFLDAAFSIGGITAGMVGTWWWLKWKNHLALFSIGIMMGGLLLLGITKNLAIVVVGVVLVGLGTSFVRALLQSVQQMATDPGFHGRMASFRMLCNQASVVITGPIFGYVASAHGVHYVFLLLSGISFAGMVWAFFQARDPQFAAITKQKPA
ncbi:MFS transporter [Halobacillus sp. B29]|uniref:MFS transporter n=1 Tax=Halobacillus sp. B29 TaxID=3457432 RepID=UPI003FCE1CE4